jgi:hypothetical protein
MAWFLRALQADDGRWFCRRGQTFLDDLAEGGHDRVEEAVAHLIQLYDDAGNAAQVILHYADGTIRELDTDL